MSAHSLDENYGMNISDFDHYVTGISQQEKKSKNRLLNSWIKISPPALYFGSDRILIVAAKDIVPHSSAFF
ncbi:hypothetical protein OUZ56_010591 [Daphnia magna]|uniref:Uncharacterized protein n=1 Tax=Daphnia magna TaxID=35525 RepID=A0ABR0AJ25_9CRUS|nr:hypothetical protein OUZ56_010591 [Daphnia magna]